MKARVKKQTWKFPKGMFLIFLAFLCVLYIQFAYIALFKNIYGINIKEFALNRNTTSSTIIAKRGNIYDHNKNALAINVASYTVIAYLSESRTGSSPVPLHVKDVKETAKQLSPVLNMPEEKLISLMSQDLYQVELGPGGRGITELTKQTIEDMNLPGIDFIEDQKRYYPNGDFASYIIGYAKKNEQNEIIGEMGIESKYNEMLSGKNGYLSYQKDLNGYKIPDTPEEKIEPTNGNDIYLTLDASIQRFLEDSVKTTSKEYEPEWMIISAMDAKTGKILGSASTPSFDPNIKNITNYENPLSSYLFEPGSTMKIYTYMCAMELGKYDGNTTYTSGKYTIGANTVKDWNGYGWGTLTYDLGFEYSSNVAIANIMQTIVTKEELKECFTKFGFNDITNIELGRELASDLNFNYDIETVNAGFGQGILTTPVQHLQALSIIANNGRKISPHIVDKIVDSSNKVVYESKIEQSEPLVKQETIDKIKSLMYNVVNGKNEGTTGKRYYVEGMDVIGKTGTAQIYDDVNGGYLSGQTDYIYSFSGIYPKDDPEIILYAAIKKPKVGSTQVLSEPVVDVIKNIAKYKGINTTSKETKETKEIKEYELGNVVNKSVSEIKEKLKKNNIKYLVIGDGDTIIKQYPTDKILTSDKVILFTNGEYKMPSLIGLSKRELMKVLENIKVNYKIEGYGYVTSQSIPKDKEITPDTELNIVLENKYNIE